MTNGFGTYGAHALSFGRPGHNCPRRVRTSADLPARSASPGEPQAACHRRRSRGSPHKSVGGELVEPWTDAHRMPGPVPAALRQAQGERPLIEYFFSGLERDVDRHFLDERLQRNTELIVRNRLRDHQQCLHFEQMFGRRWAIDDLGTKVLDADAASGEAAGQVGDDAGSVVSDELEL